MFRMNNVPLLERKMIENGYVVFYTIAGNEIECFKEFDDFYKARNFIIKLDNFKRCLFVSNGKIYDTLDSKEKINDLFWIKIQLDEQESFFNDIMRLWKMK
ncbi:hypothetical protein [uncultured Campylobacter sp.]|uniref:hypothetical protein n=1 Tax=uncultured Campylobacter sp. TaxID=218934 RepID=UPI002607C3CC|nr:hypothetical protein [uncultured Campylobacter sp.]